MKEESVLHGRGNAAHGAGPALVHDPRADQSLSPSRRQVEEVAVRVMSAQVAKHCVVPEEIPGDLLALVNRIA